MKPDKPAASPRMLMLLYNLLFKMFLQAVLIRCLNILHGFINRFKCCAKAETLSGKGFRSLCLVKSVRKRTVGVRNEANRYPLWTLRDQESADLFYIIFRFTFLYVSLLPAAAASAIILHSVLKLFTGLPNAALRDWYPIVKTVIRRMQAPAMKKTFRLNGAL